MKIPTLLLLLATSTPAMAAADPSPAAHASASSAADPDKKKEVDAHFQQGLQLNKEGHPKEALLQFQIAHFMAPENPNILYNMARIEQFTGEELVALKHYKEALKSEASMT